MFGFGKKKQEAPKPAPPPPAPRRQVPVLKDVSAKEAQERLAKGALLLDVREDVEIRTACVKGAVHIPMNQIPDRLKELDRDKEIICMCHHGGRSAGVAGFLMEQGFPNVLNLSGGIAAWASDVDPSVPQY